MNTQVEPLYPGATLGVIGGGQLGLYFVLAARAMGYRTAVLDPNTAAPAMAVADVVIAAAYDDESALGELASVCDAVTTEFENVPAASLEQVARVCRVAPSADAVAVAQDRHVEKQTALSAGLQPVPYRYLASSADVDALAEELGKDPLAQLAFPAILKTACLGYDGKGQQVCGEMADVAAAFTSFGEVPCVLEQRIDLAVELSVILTRTFAGNVAAFPVAENVHRNGVLDTTTVPSPFIAAGHDELAERAVAAASGLANTLDYVGVLGVEFFIDQHDALWFNEMAPRPHNSGHYTLDATVVSQFEQQVRALCGLSLGSTRLLTSVCMLNVLGDAWATDTDMTGEPTWADIVGNPETHLHLYGKSSARPGRKMGHINCVAEGADAAMAAALTLRAALPGH